MTTRKYDFVSGVETSSAPSATDPSAPTDPVILSYLEDNFVQGGQTMATITTLKNIATTTLIEGDIRFVKDQNVAFRYSSSASNTGDDYFYLTPVSGIGRWIRVTDMQHATGNLTVPGALTVTGDLTVNGTTTTISTSNLTVEDANITVNLGGSTSTANSNVAGITVDTDTTDARLGYDSTLTSKFKAGNVGSESEVLVAAGAQTVTGTKTFTATPSITPAVNLVEQGSAPATPAASNRAVYATSTGLAHVNSAGTVANVINDVGTQVISGVKTFQNAQVFTGNPDFQGTPQISIGERFIEQGSAPTTPAAGSRTLYAAASGFKQVDSTGLVSDIGGSGGGSGSGEINVITSSSTASGWVASGAGLTVGTSTTGSELPLEGVITSGIKITPVSGTTDYVYYRFTMPEGLFNTKLKLAWYQEALSGYASGDLKVEMHTNTLSNYTGTDATIPLSTDVSGVSGIPNAKGQYISYFESNSSLYYEIRFYRTAGSTALVMQNVIVGPGITKQGAIITRWENYTPTNTQGFGTVTSVDVRYRRVGGSIEVQGQFTTGTVTASEAQIGLPTGLTLTGPTGAIVVGKFDQDGSQSDNNHNVLATSGDTFVNISRHNMQSTATNMLLPAAANVFAASTTRAAFFFSAPIAEWAGSGVLNIGENDVEYAASTNGTWDANSVAANTIYGLDGAPITGNLTAERTKVVKLNALNQATQAVDVELFVNGRWVSASGTYPYQIQNTATYGVRIVGTSGDSTSVTIVFGRYLLNNGATFGAAGLEWGALSSPRWRVVRSIAGQPVGFGEATATSSGLMKRPGYAALTISSGANPGTASTSLVDISGVTLSITTTKTSRIFFCFNGSVRNNTAAAVNYLNIMVNGVLQNGNDGMYNSQDTAGYFYNMCVSGLSQELGAGTYTVKLQGKVSAGTMTILADSATNLKLCAYEV